ncbi:ATP-binding protein [Pseudooceanicola onchidii]|uniref:ATP-binding protein n=1 Tax=Pseudooceanicola onchidii TaxID=2562279 RepID=UPI0010AA7BC1|nr:ATP-binding protein [Pseudooceanicola onchidii]
MSLPPPVVEPAKKRPAHVNPFYIVGLGAMLFMSVLLVGSLMIDVRHKLAELESAPQDNVQWTLSQFEVEFLALTLAVQEADTARALGQPVDLTDLRRRYDILYSRAQTLSQSEVYRRAFDDPALSTLFALLATEVRVMADRIDADDSTLIADLPGLLATLTLLREQTRAVTTEGNRALVHDSDASRQEISQVLLRLAMASFLLLVILAAMVVQFRRMAQISVRQLQENLSTSARLEATFNTSRDSIVVVEDDGRIDNLNRTAADLFNRDDIYTRGARIGTMLAYRSDTGLEPLTGAQLLRMAAERQTGIRLIGIRPDETTFPVEMSVGTSTREKRPICVCVIRDISHQMNVETELKQSRDHALAGERAKARFLGVISHEMRTPLNGILGTLDLIEEEVTQDDHAGPLRDTFLPMLRNSSSTLLTLVNDVLDITQIESGMKLNTRAFDLDRMLGDLTLAFAAGARETGNRVEVTSADPIGTVAGDPDRLRQVISNLLGNAIKFTKDGVITIEASRLSEELIEIQVIDTGFGMTAAELERIFDDFVRTDRAINQQIQGTGLGLGIAKTLVEAMGGTIGAESEPGEGSLFWVRLPLPPAMPLAEDETEDRPGTGTCARILLVEDNATNRFIARRLMENDGHRVTEAVNGAAAVDLANREHFDLILMDISMPVMDGIAATQAIRAGTGPNSQTRIIALTAHLTGGLDQTQTDAVMDAVLHKPIDRAALRRQIASAVGKAVGPPQQDDDQPPFDSLLAELDPATATRLIDAFVAETDRALADLPGRLAAAEPQDDAVARALHDAAGGCASFGLPRLHRLLIEGESDWRAGDRAAAEAKLSDACRIWPDLRAQVLDARPTIPVSP